jgi:hypothetical protein
MKLRAQFISALCAKKPRYIIDVNWKKKTGTPDVVSGPDTTKEFKELDNFKETFYRIVLEREDYKIWERSL